MQKLQEISQAFNRPQPTHREPSQERPPNQEDALGAKLYAWKKRKKATQVPQGDEYEHHYAEDPYEMSEEHTVKIDDGEDDVKVPGGVLIGYWRDNTWRWPNLARLALDALSIPAMAAECERRGRRRYHHSEWPSAPSLSRRRSVTTSGFARISTETAPARSTGLLR